MSIYDCFMFSHELDLLEIRFGVLDDVVDFFILTESDTTFSGKEKPLYFKDNLKRFKKWQNKIIYNKIDIPPYDNPWARETYSRNSPLYAVDYQSEDIILSSDADEIPKPEVVAALPMLLAGLDKHVTFKQSMYIYYLNNFETNEWYGTRATIYKNMANRTLQDIRNYTESPVSNDGIVIQDGGWHFTSCGDVELIKKKIESFSHSELNREDIINNIESNIKNNNDLYYREKTYSYVPVDESFPKYIRDNVDKYSHLIHKEVG